jgi:TRAP-type uncharacterized transport system fused permease subunit
MMKRLGYRDEFAGGVEAAASSGGQITPPIMGAGAFIMSELISQPCLKIALSAILPAFLFYVCVWISIDLEARKTQLKRVPPEDLPPAQGVFNWYACGPLVLTISVLLASMLMGHSATKAAFFAIVTNLALFIFYCAILSGLTPPVCTAVFAAATIAQANWLKVAGVSIRLAIMKYIIPFFFIYRPSILFVGHWYNIIETIFVTWMSANLFAIGTVGYYRFPVNKPLRVVILLVAAILIIPGMVSDLIGVFFMGGLIAWQRIQSNRLHMSAIDSGTGGPANAG